VMSCSLHVGAGAASAAGFDVLNRLTRCIEPEIAAQDGWVSEQIGGSLLALFPGSTGPGGRGSHGAAQDAVEAALAIHRAVLSFRAEAGVPQPDLRVRIGIATGKVLLGAVGSDHSLRNVAMGEGVDLSRRILEAAEQRGARILISQGTQDTLSTAKGYATRRVVSLETPGNARPTAVLEVLQDEPADALDQTA
jgi:adenylate cyclase